MLCLSRQNLPQLENSTLANASKGGYVVHDEQNADITIVSTGSEVAIAVEAAEKLASEGVKARVVSLPCFGVFEAQPADYKLKVLPSGAPVMSVEAYSTFGWSQYSHEHFGLSGFGASGPYKQVYDHFGLNGEGVASRAKKVIDFYKKKGGPVVSPLICQFFFSFSCCRKQTWRANLSLSLSNSRFLGCQRVESFASF